MFIDVTRFGGGRRLRLAIAAIAYTDDAPEGCAIRLIGGDSLRVDEDPATIERRVDAALGLAAVSGPIDPDLEAAALAAGEASGIVSSEHAVQTRVDIALSRRRGKRA